MYFDKQSSKAVSSVIFVMLLHLPIVELIPGVCRSTPINDAR